LKGWIETNGVVTKCGICGSDDRAADIGAFTAHIDSVIRRHYYHDDEGELAAVIIARVAGVSLDVARLVVNMRHRDEAIGQSFYDYGPLSLGGRYSLEHAKLWSRFKEIVKHEARFFGAEARAALDSLLRDIDTFCGGAAVRSLTTNDILLRARLARNYDEADQWFKSPASELHAPPKSKAIAGRMNSAGVRVFYGALQERIAVAELRPPIGSHVVVGSFAPTRALRILDLGGLERSPLAYADLFSPHFDTVSSRLTFLQELEQEISLPVQPHDEVLEYVPTQIFAEYVKIVHNVDGVAYRSAQISRAPEPGQIAGRALAANERNIVLFGDAAVTVDEVQTEGTQPGLRFVQGSQQTFDITEIDVKYQRNMWAHFADQQVDDGE
jgi:hypothetical protein